MQSVVGSNPTQGSFLFEKKKAVLGVYLCRAFFVMYIPLSVFLSLSSRYSREVTTLLDLINAQQQMAEWQFLPAIISLQSAHNKLSNWNSIVPLGNQVHVYTYMYVCTACLG